jgi:transposase
MSRRQKSPLRALTMEERAWLEEISRAQSQPASHVARAKAVLAVANGSSFTVAARAAGRRSGDAVGQIVARFNRDGLAAVEPDHGGGPQPVYGTVASERILAEFGRTPDREQDGTATWSLTTLQRALRKAPDGLPAVSRDTIVRVLRDAGWSWQRSRSWCKTGTVVRKRKAGTVEVVDPDATPQKS